MPPTKKRTMRNAMQIFTLHDLMFYLFNIPGGAVPAGRPPSRTNTPVNSRGDYEGIMRVCITATAGQV